MDSANLSSRSWRYSPRESRRIVGTGDGAQRDLDNFASSDLAIRFQVGRLHPVLERTAYGDGYRRPAGADDQTGEPVGARRSGEQRCRGTDVRRDDVRLVQLEGIGEANDEVAHGFRIHQRFAPLRAAKSGEINGDHVHAARCGHACSNAKTLSGHGLSSIACCGPVPPYANRIDSPSMVIVCG